MRWTSRALAVAICAGAVVGPGRAAAGSGTIDTLGAQIDSGAGSVRGRVVLNPSAPLVPEPVRAPRVLPASMGSMTGSMPAFPGGGSGAAALVASSDLSFSAGTYDFTSITVDAGVTVTCTGAVAFRTSGDVLLAGAVRSTANGASIQFECGGDLTLSGGATGSPTVTTSGANAPITLDVNGRLFADVASPGLGRVAAASGGVIFRCRDVTRGMPLTRLDLSSGDGALDIRAAGSVGLNDLTAAAGGGPLEVRSYGGDVGIHTAHLTSDGALRAEAALALNCGDVSAVDALGTIDLAAFGGRIRLADTSVEMRTGGAGDVVVRADQHIELTGTTVRHRGTGDLRVESQFADFTLRTSSLAHEGTGDVSLREGSMVLAYGANVVSAAQGDVLLHGFHVEVNGDSLFSAPQGTLEVRAERSVVLRADPNAGPPRPDLAAARIDVHGLQDFNRVEVDLAAAGTGGMSLLLGTMSGSSATAVVRGKFTSAGPLSVQTTTATVLDLTGADLATVRTATFGPSPPLRIETFLAGGGEIDLDGAKVRTGDALGATSGDVTIAVRVAGGTDSEPGGEVEPIQIVDGGIVVRAARAHRSAKDPLRTRIDVEGVLDTGALSVDLAGGLEVTVGTDVRTVDVARDRSGGLRFANPALSLSLRPARTGASRVGFRLAWTGDAAAFLGTAASGQLDLRFRSAAVDAAASIRLVRGRYRLGRDTLSLLVPRVAPLSATARLADGPADTLDLRLAFVTDGVPPEVPGDVALTFGPSLTATVPASAFTTQKPGLFVARRPGPGVDLLVVDWRRGTVRFVARGVELGTFPGTDPVALDVSLGLGTQTRFLRLRLGRRGERLVY